MKTRSIPTSRCGLSMFARFTASAVQKRIASAVLALAFLTPMAQAETWNPVNINTNGAPNGYWEFLPDAYINNATTDYALLIFFHGAGNGGNGSTELVQIQNHGLNKVLNTTSHALHDYFANGEAVVLSPQTSGDGWSPAAIREFLDFARDQYRVDPRRIYLTGLSAGSNGIHGFIENDPLPYDVSAFLTTALAGALDQPGADKIAKVTPYWCATAYGDGYGGIGTASSTVNRIAGSLAGTAPTDVRSTYPGNEGDADYVATFDITNGWTWESGRVPTADGYPRMTIFTGSSHNSWDRTYATQDMFDWLFAQVKPVTTISTPADVTVSDYGQSITFSASSVDADSNAITGTDLHWSSSLDGVLGTGASINVSNLSVGVHTIYCMGIDSAHRGGYDTVTVIVPNTNAFTANFDFGPAETPASGWNSVNDEVDARIDEVLDANESLSGLRFEIVTPFAGRASNGTNSTTLYPNNVQRDYFNTASSNPQGQILVSGLNPGQAYDFTFFASRDQGGSAVFLTRYTVGSSSATLSVRQNTDQTAVISDYMADSTGQVLITVERDASMSSSVLGFLGAMVIETDGDSGGSANVAPVAVNDSATTDEDVAVLIDVLANDSDADSSPSELSIASVSQPNNGVAAIQNGEVLYTPNAGYFGSDSFSYTVTDGEDAESAMVSVTIDEVVTPPPSSGSLFSQDFSASTNVQDYVSALPDTTEFDDISAESGAGTWSISNSRLSITRSGSGSDAGFRRIGDSLLGNPDLVSLSMDVALSNMSETWSELFLVEFGDWSGLLDYGSHGNSAYLFDRLEVKGNGTDVYKLVLNGESSGSIPTDGAVRRVRWLINNSASSVNYTGYEQTNPATYSLAAGEADIWVDGVREIAGVAVGPGSGTVNIEDFRVRFSATTTFTFELDAMAISDTFSESTNAAPTAVADSVSVDEGQSVLIDALVNDSDADSGPSALSIVAVGAASHGVASIVSNEVQYVPDVGFYGSDSFSYTISDGADTAMATIQVTVNDTSIAANLTTAGLAGQSIGTGSGSSRILLGGSWEINGQGAGASGTTDALYSELETIEGDFSAFVLLQDLANEGAAPLAGLMLRESTAANAVMVQFGMAANSSLSLASRATTGASAVLETPTSTATLPDAWLMIERVGDVVSLAVSEDGVSFTVVDDVTITGLAQSLQVGLFAQSGDGVTSTRAVFSDYAIEAAYALFVRDFTSSSTVGNYVSSAPTANLFDDISAETGAGSWSIANDRLTITRLGTSDDAGFSRMGDSLIGNPDLINVTLDFAISNMEETWSELFLVELGDWSGFLDYGSNGNSSYLYERLEVKGDGDGYYKVVLNGSAAGSIAADGSVKSLSWLINNSGSSVNYTGLESTSPGSYSLAAGQADVWLDEVRVLSGIAVGPGSGTVNIEDFRVRFSATPSFTFGLDRLLIENAF
ncbi:Ig-like domain-containing protein [Cerasicoccus fimbriatus]|uniref:Ig-like domain-containing protein n=1 Tax=Cerasicoccus fimbriatus TaxID=3014554 RepID=UPI0022B5D2FD|nr:Ig-like domain-containing protein [Cerasicoccus sp. TK19100]